MWLFFYSNFERNYDVLKSKSPCILMKFSSYKNRKLKVKVWWVWTRERKKRAFLVPFILEVFFNICVLSQCIVYWIHLQNIYTFTYKKILLHTLLLLVFKIVKSFQSVLNAHAWKRFLFIFILPLWCNQTIGQYE